MLAKLVSYFSETDLPLFWDYNIFCRLFFNVMSSFPIQVHLMSQPIVAGRCKWELLNNNVLCRVAILTRPSNGYLNMRRWVTRWNWPTRTAYSRPRRTWARPSSPVMGSRSRERTYTDTYIATCITSWFIQSETDHFSVPKDWKPLP